MSEKSLEAITKQLEQALAKQYHANQGIKREGTEIIIPPHMNLKEAAKAIKDYETSMEEEEQSRVELIGHPNNCLYAFHKAMSSIYGALLSDHNYGWFGAKLPGRNVIVPLSATESVRIPVHNVQVPGLPINMSIGYADPNEWSAGEVGVAITFTAKRKYGPLIADIEASTRQYMREFNLFKGKALDSTYKFIDLSGFHPERVIYSAEQRRQLTANIFSLITNTSAAKRAKVPLKRGILLHGPYGTGKTLTALNVASLCSQHGWTFILVREGDDIAPAITQAQELQPAVVFFEDIDRAARENRDNDVNGILNTIDGILSKDSEVMVILTTNHIEKVNKAMMRPGRLDAVIELGTLDAEATMALVLACANSADGFLSASELDSHAICTAASGYTPAFIKEAVSKASLYAIARGDESLVLSTEDIVSALNELRPQYNYMTGTEEKPITLQEQLVEGFTKIAEEVAEELVIDKVMPKMRLLHGNAKEAMKDHNNKPYTIGFDKNEK